MDPPAHQTRDQEGFILIEVLVSALILAIVAGAVLALITATTRSAASERDHSIAYALAQEDQARLRTMRIASLNDLDPPPRKETIGGTTFYVESRGKFVNNTTGTSSCTGEGASADYVELTSTVSSDALLHPVSIHSIVSPSTESLTPNHGTFAFQAKNAAGEPLSGVSISGTGPGNFNGVTDEEGCANFADVPAGNYEVTTYANGLINPEGKETATKGMGVEASATQQVVLYFDRAATIKASFTYKEPGSGKSVAAPIDSMELFNAENEDKAITSGTPGGTGASTREDKVVYPFKTPYAVYAGSCETNNPDPKNEGVNSAAIANLTVTPGSTATATIQVPALNVYTTYNGAKVQGAEVVVTDTQCQYNTKSVKREFKTDKAGHIALPTAEAAETEAVGLPYGEYKVCASAYVSSAYRRAEATVSVKSLTSSPLQTLALSGNSSTKACE